MESTTVLLVEDDFLNRRLTRKVLTDAGYQVVEAAHAQDAIAMLEQHRITIAILDIHLGEGRSDGISLGRMIQEKYNLPFLYLTAYEQNDIIARAVATTPHSYITKPFKNIDLLAAVAIATRHQKQKLQSRPTIFTKGGEYTVELAVDDIDFIESEGNYLLIHAAGDQYKSRSTIKQILQILPQDRFLQTHRAYVVNKMKIDGFNSKSIVLGRHVVPLSKNYQHLFDTRRSSGQE